MLVCQLFLVSFPIAGPNSDLSLDRQDAQYGRNRCASVLHGDFGEFYHLPVSRFLFLEAPKPVRLSETNNSGPILLCFLH